MRVFLLDCISQPLALPQPLPCKKKGSSQTFAGKICSRTCAPRKYLSHALKKLAKCCQKNCRKQEQKPVYKTSLSQEDPTEISTALQYITFTSSSTVDNFFTLLKPECSNIETKYSWPVLVASYGFTPDIQPEKYTIVALVDALVKNMNT